VKLRKRSGYFLRLSTTSGFTQFGNDSPLTPANTLSAQSRAMAFRVPTVALAIWGTITQFGSWYNS
jgi:hypothetical protein